MQYAGPSPDYTFPSMDVGVSTKKNNNAFPVCCILTRPQHTYTHAKLFMIERGWKRFFVQDAIKSIKLRPQYGHADYDSNLPTITQSSKFAPQNTSMPGALAGFKVTNPLGKLNYYNYIPEGYTHTPHAHTLSHSHIHCIIIHTIH